METETSLEAELCALEERLLEPAVRANPDELDQLLAADFVEFGSSGGAYNKQQIIAGLQAESGVRWSLTEFQARLLAPGVALATYRAVKHSEQEEPRHSLRSSIWVLIAGRWQIAFHQGTPT